MMNAHDEGLTQLSRMGGGGATVARSAKGIVIGIWDKEKLMTNDLNQNAGDVAMAVERI